jgi:hypothetical protein
MANKNKIFNSFVYNVLLHGYSKDEIYQPTNFDLWFCYKNQNFENNKDLRLRNITNIFCDSNNNKGDNFNMNKISAVYLSNLGQFSIENVSKEDDLPATASYQEMLDIPASAYLFSKYDAPVKTPLKRDTCYTNFDYYVDDTFNSKESNNVLNRTNGFDITKLADKKLVDEWKDYCKDYFESDYNFCSGFSASDYNVFDVKQDFVIEDKINMKTTDKDFDIVQTNSNSYVGGALLITWYNGTRVPLYNYEGKLYYENTLQEKLKTIGKDIKFMTPTYKLFPRDYSNAIPFCYIDLPKTYNLRDNKVNVQWSENGIVSLK